MSTRRVTSAVILGLCVLTACSPEASRDSGTNRATTPDDLSTYSAEDAVRDFGYIVCDRLREGTTLSEVKIEMYQESDATIEESNAIVDAAVYLNCPEYGVDAYDAYDAEETTSGPEPKYLTCKGLTKGFSITYFMDYETDPVIDTRYYNPVVTAHNEGKYTISITIHGSGKSTSEGGKWAWYGNLRLAPGKSGTVDLGSRHYFDGLMVDSGDTYEDINIKATLLTPFDDLLTCDVMVDPAS